MPLEVNDTCPKCGGMIDDGPKFSRLGLDGEGLGPTWKNECLIWTCSTCGFAAVMKKCLSEKENG